MAKQRLREPSPAPAALSGVSEALADRLRAARPDAVVLPAEAVALHAVTLPVRGAGARRAAAPFALEDRLGQPLEAVHVALLRDLDAGASLAAVVSRAAMISATGAAARSGPILPETLALPVPQPSGWTVWAERDRAVIRAADGTGFACRAGLVAPLWSRAGRPEVALYGSPLPQLDWVPVDAAPPLPDPAEGSADLAQGAYAPPRGWAGALRLVAATAALAAVLHLALAWADLGAERRVADALRASTEAALAADLPQATVFDAPEALLAQIGARSATPRAAFVPLFERSAAVLLQTGLPLSVERLAWDGAAGALTLAVAARGLEELQAVETSLRAAGLGVALGAATAGPSGAEAQLVLRAPDA